MPASDDIDEQFLQAFSQLKSSEVAENGDAVSSLEERIQLEVDKHQLEDGSNAEALTAMMDKLLKIPEEMGDSALQDADVLVDQLMDEIICGEMLEKPFEELAEKYARFLDEKGDCLDPKKKETYSQQASIVGKINRILRQPEYQSQAKHHQGEILDLLDQLQASGNPPAEVMDVPGSGRPDECGIM